MRVIAILAATILVATSVLIGERFHAGAASAGTHYVFVDDGTSPTDYIDTFALARNGFSYSLSFLNSTAMPGPSSSPLVTAPATNIHPFCIFRIDGGDHQVESFAFSGTSLTFVNAQTEQGANLQAYGSYLFMFGPNPQAMQIQSGCTLGTPSPAPSSPPPNAYSVFSVVFASRIVAQGAGAQPTIDVLAVDHPTAATTSFKLLKQT